MIALWLQGRRSRTIPSSSVLPLLKSRQTPDPPGHGPCWRLCCARCQGWFCVLPLQTSHSAQPATNTLENASLFVPVTTGNEGPEVLHSLSGRIQFTLSSVIVFCKVLQSLLD